MAALTTLNITEKNANNSEMWQPIYGWNIRSLNKEVDCLI